jgi:hypothetical protein
MQCRKQIGSGKKIVSGADGEAQLMDRPLPLTRRERLRRVVLLCCHFTRNLAFYRVGRPGEPRSPNREFWVTVNGNFLDECVLEWCKLLGDTRGDHYWKQVVSDAEKFEMELLQNLGMDAAEFESYRNEMREYRDKFLAHLDSLREIKFPKLNIAKASVEFYHAYIADHESEAGDLAAQAGQRALPATTAELRNYFDQCEAEAVRVYIQIDRPS